MKDNTAVVKGLLMQALSNTPDDFSLREAKVHIRRALGVVEDVEVKRSSREEARLARKNLAVSPAANVNSLLNVVENEIQKEKDKLKQIKDRSKAHGLIDREDQNGTEYVMG